jgi:hypothetical protein
VGKHERPGQDERRIAGGMRRIGELVGEQMSLQQLEADQRRYGFDAVVQLPSGEIKYASELTAAETAAGGIVAREDLEVPPDGGYEREDLDVDEGGQRSHPI